jgi:hypothetical protein
LLLFLGWGSMVASPAMNLTFILVDKAVAVGILLQVLFKQGVKAVTAR